MFYNFFPDCHTIYKFNWLLKKFPSFTEISEAERLKVDSFFEWTISYLNSQVKNESVGLVFSAAFV